MVPYTETSICLTNVPCGYMNVSGCFKGADALTILHECDEANVYTATFWSTSSGTRRNSAVICTLIANLMAFFMLLTM
ncbi:Schizosaccharomyces pombe specific protein [Schizosaccharomyces pombe]|uniref:Uncharacterized protein C11D3.19 n=1 Tax=Schizosaccharomyces pombe (strain 972 / ATCC 24843) TaxID=284812 RepID=YAOJ_SCHPO|nr:uncharacterized protein SPAC11D3.19 [Schizosaccharomyces pombe]G2TRM3.1 RecName: Full=Uncharacterized protein C11D3.19 [Schizosaccharomyces pombe 972h-]CCD31309.1 sequence orphan [Schizosaccharomyces pombe]|eukprot:NP_001343099.1 uncharacterized protein SPAC11D3.19 [Schizosaccharomyces pombe]